MKAIGTFEISLKPCPAYAEGCEGITLARMSIDKTFAGDLEATSCGEMLSARTQTEGSAGYVAIEQVVGTLGGKQGTFVLQHFGTMAAGQHRLVLEVVPDSGTGALKALSGTMNIEIQDGTHNYVFEYGLG